MHTHVSRSVLATALLASAVAAAVACSSGDSATGTTSTPATPASPATPAAVASVTLSPATCMLSPSSQCQLTVTLTDAAGAALTGRTVTWSSSSGSATVSSAGLVTAVSAGTATITASSEAKTAVAAITVASSSAALVVQVDAAATGALVVDLLGANRKPQQYPQGGVMPWDGASLYQAFGITQVRLSDGGSENCGTYTVATKVNVAAPGTPVTGCTVTPNGGLPHFKWTPTQTDDASLNNTANYNFSAVDSAVAAVVSSGGKVYLRMGDGYNGPNDTDDPVAYAKVATNIYKHVIGQFKPSGVTADPAYVEVMNEPDGGFWQGSVATFNTLFTEMVTRIRAAAAAAGKTVVIGGPGFTQNYLTKTSTAGNVANGFISAVNAASQLDFFSVHNYGNCSPTLLQSATFLRNVRSYINGQGLSAMPMHITEWNVGLGQTCGEAKYAEQRMQSFTSGTLTQMQDPAQKISAAHMYAGMPIMSLFDFNSVSGKVRINPGAWAFWAHSRLRGATSVSAQICPAGTSCVNGYAAESQALLALAGTLNGTRTTIVTNDGASPVTYTLRVKGLTSGATVTATISTPPAGTQDVVVSGNPIRADAAALAAMIASPAKDVRAGLVAGSGQIELTLTIPAYSLQVIDVK